MSGPFPRGTVTGPRRPWGEMSQTLFEFLEQRFFSDSGRRQWSQRVATEQQAQSSRHSLPLCGLARWQAPFTGPGGTAGLETRGGFRRGLFSRGAWFRLVSIRLVKQ